MSERVFSSLPSTGTMFLRAGLGALPGASLLPFASRQGKELPDLELVVCDLEIDRDRLAAYDRVCGFRLSDALPSTYVHVLAFPLHMALITDSRFPFPAAGLVHIENRIVQHRPILASERLSLRVRATGPEPHRRGLKFSLLTEARVGEELVWEEESVNLRRTGGDGTGGGEKGGGEGGSGREEGARAPGQESEGAEEPDELAATAQWRLPGDLGRRYASVSGDHNPIHLHPLTARLFGFPAAIVHGMWTQARALAALEGRLPSAYTAEVAFKRPILLPARVAFAERDAGEGATEIVVCDARKGTPHLVGRVAPGS